MAEKREQPSGENDPQADAFSFVDKRRTADAPEAEEQEDQVTDDASVGEEELEDIGGPESTHQIALYALGLLQMNAFQQLGLISDPATGKANRDLGQARIAIDCVAALAGVLDGPDSDLEPRLRQDVRRVLTDLRLNYVTQTKMADDEAK